MNCFAFAAGKPNEALAADWYHEKVDSFAIITARDVSWNRIFEKVGKGKNRCVERYAIKKENKWSVALAEKSGYHYSHTYTAYEMWK